MSKFTGFVLPRQNWSKLPNQMIEWLPLITSEAELKVILYILRHTWGYHDSEKRIATSEFATGRRKRDGTKIDNGIGLNEPAIREGLRKAEEHGFVLVEIDDSDKGRIRKYYSLAMQDDAQGVELRPPEMAETTPWSSKNDPPSEKDTLVNKPLKETTSTPADAGASRPAAGPFHNVNTHTQDESVSIEGGQEALNFKAYGVPNRKQPETMVKTKCCLVMASDWAHDACPGCGRPILWENSFQASQRQNAKEKVARTQNAAQDGAWQQVQAVAMQFPAPKPLQAFKFNSSVKDMREQQDPEGSGLVELAKRLANHKKSTGQTAEGFLSWLANTYNLYGPNAYLDVVEEAKKVSEVIQHIPKDGSIWAVPSIEGVPDWSRAEKL